MAYRAVLFDLDGTLLDSIEDLMNSMNTVLARFEFPQHPVEKYKIMVGDGVDILALRAMPEHVRDNEEIRERILAGMRQEYGRRWAERTQPYDGIPELLEGLRERGIPATIFSNKSHEFTQMIVEKLLGKWKFERVIGARPGYPKKPDPTVALEIARDLQIRPAEFLYVGDTNTDMNTANAAGMYPVGALWGFRSKEELQAAKAKRLIAHPMELLSLLV